MAIYKNKVQWRGEHLGYTWMQNGVDMEFSAPPDLFGKAGVLTPEDAFVAAANTCYFMMVVWACERFKMDMVSLEMEAVGEVEEHFGPHLLVKRVTFCPKIVVKGKSQEMVQRALDMAMKYSTINQSFKSELVIRPEIVVQ